MNARLRRWYTFLSQFRLSFFHLPGIKNEMCDYLSRHVFEENFGVEIDTLAKDAFARMDSQLDLSMQVLFRLNTQIGFQEKDYLESEMKELWKSLEPYQSKLLENRLYYRNESSLFCERLLVVPEQKLEQTLLWCHQSNGHPGSVRTLLFFLRYFFSPKERKKLLDICKGISQSCEVCLRAKPSIATDRGLVSALPIPQISNQILYIDFVSMDTHNTFDYVLTIVDALTRYVRFLPCTKNITGEGTFKLILSEWISHYGKPREILSDNDIRFSSEKGFYQSAFQSLGISTHFSLPRHPESNGLCERTNRSFVQNIRILSMQMKTLDWPKLVPMVTWVMNSPVSPQTGFTPSELFLGSESWRFDGVPEPGIPWKVNPQGKMYPQKRSFSRRMTASIQ